MSDSEKPALRIAEGTLYNAKGCRYSVNGTCILSDCPCQAAVDGHMVCSSYTEGWEPLN